jgi:hypothetical protein
MDAKKELHEKDTFVLTRKKEKGKKVICEVVIMEVSVRRSSNNLMNSKSFQSQVVGKRKMVDEEKHSNDVSTCLDFCSMELSQTPLLGGKMMSTMIILVKI